MCENCCKVYCDGNMCSCFKPITIEELVEENQMLKKKVKELENECNENIDLSRENSILHSLLFKGRD